MDELRGMWLKWHEDFGNQDPHHLANMDKSMMVVWQENQIQDGLQLWSNPSKNGRNDGNEGGK